MLATQPESVLLIDVRSPLEYQESHIENSIYILLSDFEMDFGIKRLQTLTQEHPESEQIVLYCSVGARALKVQKILEQQGIVTSNLRGGMTAWESLK